MNTRGETDDDILIVGRNELALRIQDQRAVRPHAVQADGKQLHDFARVIFVGMRAECDVALVVAAHVEVKAHRRMTA